MACREERRSSLAPVLQRGGRGESVPWIPLVGLFVVLFFSRVVPVPATENDAWFQEIANSVGVTFQHHDGRSGKRYFIETAASGGGWIDYDQDGDLDLYLINGAATPGSQLTITPRNALYENRGTRFVEVTDQAGVGDPGYGMGMCVGDYDADGWLDFVVTNYGPDRLYRNRGDGTFEEVGHQAGVADPRWGTGCAFGDLDGDGDLDLYVAHYVNFLFEGNHFQCGDLALGMQGYCTPHVFDGQIDSLYINQGDSTFQEAGEARGIVQTRSERGFGVLLSDIDTDGDMDIYVANDGSANRLYLNTGNGSFADHSLLSGTALNMAGDAEAGMGVDAGDVDRDGLIDLIVTNFSLQTNTFYRNLGGGYFDDWTNRVGLTRPSYPYVGWGVQFVDFDNDGDLDMAVVNGHIQDNIERVQTNQRYREINQLFENIDAGRFQDVTAHAGPAWARRKVSRGLAAGDWNNDGRLDLLITNTNDTIDLLENRRTTDHHWLGVVLEGPPQNRFAIGAHVTLQAGELRLVREVRSGGSFLSQPDLRLHFGLGAFNGPVEVDIRWPDGRRQTEQTQQLDRYWKIAYQPK